MLRKLLCLAGLVAASVSSASFGADCILYEHAGQQGARYTYTADSENMALRDMGWNDVVSSVWVRSGYKLTLGQHEFLGGATYSWYGSNCGREDDQAGHYENGGCWWNMGSWNDHASSAKCVRW